MSERETMDVPKYETNELLANVRTHVPDFDMASEIMRRIALTDLYEAAEKGRKA